MAAFRIAKQKVRDGRVRNQEGAAKPATLKQAATAFGTGAAQRAPQLFAKRPQIVCSEEPVFGPAAAYRTT